MAEFHPARCHSQGRGLSDEHSLLYRHLPQNHYFATLMSRVPGANVNNNGPLSGIAQYRGMFGDRINVVSDGSNYKPACANAMDAPLSHVPASLTEILKVYRGIAPVSSGMETLGGTIITESRRSEFSDDGFLIENDSSLLITELGRTFVRNIAMKFDAYLDEKSKNSFSRTI